MQKGAKQKSSADILQKYKSTERDYEMVLEYAKFMTDYEKQYLLLFLTEKAKFHLRTPLISDKLPPEEYWPKEHDLKKAKECLDGLSHDMLPNEVSLYAVNYYSAHCDLCMWNEEYCEAVEYVKKAKEFFAHERRATYIVRTFNKHLKLLEESKELAEILDEFPG